MRFYHLLHLPLCFSFLPSLVFCQCEIPWRFGSIHEISAIRHLLRLLGSFIWQQIWALLLLCSNYWERKLRQFRQFSDCSYPERFTMSVMAEKFNLLFWTPCSLRNCRTALLCAVNTFPDITHPINYALILQTIYQNMNVIRTDHVYILRQMAVFVILADVNKSAGTESLNHWITSPAAAFTTSPTSS